MMHFLNHSADRRSILLFYHLRNSLQTKILKSTLLIYGSTNFAFNLLNLYCSHNKPPYPLNTFSILIPRVPAMV